MRDLMESRRSFHNRSGRKEKKKLNGIFISALVFLGIVLVVWVGTNAFIKSFEQSSGEGTYQKEKGNVGEKTEVEEEKPSEEEDEVAVEDTTTTDEDSSSTESEDDTSAETETPTSTEPVTDGNWKPIGTTQSEPHVSSYEQGSVDWNEKIKAIEYATNIPEDNIQLLWLGNNGDHNSSYGVVTAGSDKSDPYVVYLEWITEKGWKPTEVVKLSELSEEKQEAIKSKYQGGDEEAEADAEESVVAEDA